MAKRRSAAAAAAPAAAAGHSAVAEDRAATGRPADGDHGLMPLDYMLQVLRDPEASPAERKWAAEKAAPYLHARLQTVDHSGAMTLRHEDALEDLQ